ncbi:MFS transporter [Nocardioides rubriscoriae]|uniref:MFS transporter n=1 Tax=Nocardioides rubriscoriae TaxID=642762 RepID=UPI0011E01044|nr:MFS transporter [Nocardioides rubriscoriae]
MPSYRRLARNHDFTVLWVGQTVSSLGSRMSLFVFPLLAYALTGSAVVAAVAEALHLLGVVCVLLPAGVLADRVDRRRLMRLASGSGVLLHASLAVAGLTDHLVLAHLLVVALLTGVCAGLFAPAETSAVRAVVATDDLTTALSQNQAREHVAALLGAPLGGALYAVTRWLPFAADAVTYAVSWVLLGRIRTDLSPMPHEGRRARVRDDLATGARFVLGQPLFRTLLTWSALTNLLANALFFVAVLRLISADVDPVHLGLVETAAGAAGIAGAVVAPWVIERFATGWLTIVIAWSFLPVLVPLALWSDPAVVAVALGSVMLLNPAGNAGIGAYRIAVTPPDLLGRSQSFMSFASMSAMPLAPVLAGTALTVLGGAGAVLALGALLGVAALVPTLSRTVRSVPRPEVWRAEVAPAASAPATV